MADLIAAFLGVLAQRLFGQDVPYFERIAA